MRKITLLLGLVLTTGMLAWCSIVQAQVDRSPISATAESIPKTSVFRYGKRVVYDTAGYYFSMAMGSDEKLHASFTNSTTNQLLYAIYDNSDWHVQVVDVGGKIERNSIALGPDNVPHIAYNKSGDLVYTHLSGTMWVSSTVVTGTHWYNSIAVDHDSRAHIAYSSDWLAGGFAFGDVDYAFWDGEKWAFETIETDGEAVRDIAMALDGQDRPYILYKKRFFGGVYSVRLKYKTNSTWEVRILEHGYYDRVPYYTCDQFPPGAALIVTQNGLYVTYSWHGQKAIVNNSTELIQGGECNDAGDIAVDNEGRLHVVFMDWLNVRYAIRSVDGQWSVVSLDQLEGDWWRTRVSISATSTDVHFLYLDGKSNLIHWSRPIRIYLPLIMRQTQ